MKQPSLDLLMQKVDSKYTLVVAAAKRARTITEDNPTAGPRAQKPVTQALYEIASGKIKYERTKAGIK
ncbi:MAG TPA: DNA-directed RNA polymerase subunit omega [Verrucomicrobiae bacterium]|nr:DNA-directed RNA polymerase subunit omega [Verrucomicrobiae bacterium]